MHVLLASNEQKALNPFMAALERDNRVDVRWLRSGQEVLALVDKNKVDVVIVAEELGDSDGLTLVKTLAQKKPLINCAMVSSLPPDEFHEKTEGLGVFMQLQTNPGATEAKRMMDLLGSINALLAG